MPTALRDARPFAVASGLHAMGALIALNWEAVRASIAEAIAEVRASGLASERAAA